MISLWSHIALGRRHKYFGNPVSLPTEGPFQGISITLKSMPKYLSLEWLLIASDVKSTQNQIFHCIRCIMPKRVTS